MSEFDQRRLVRRVFSSPLVLLLLAGVLFFLVRGVWSIYLKERVSVSELKLAQERLLKLEGRQKALAAATEKLSTESGIEYEIRDRLQMAKAGEKQIVIVDSPSAASQITPAPRSFLQKIINFFTIR